MVKLSAATKHALSLVAHAMMAKGISNNVTGMGSFYDFWMKEQTPKDREIIEAFLQLSTRARKDFSAMLAKDMKDSNG